MNIKVILAAALIASSLAACTDKNSNKGAESSTEVEQQTTTDSHAAQAAPSAPVLPPFTLQNANGEAVNLQSFKGKKVFVNLWATWCPPCRAEMPSIQRLSKQVDPDKVAFVMVSLDDDFNKAKSYVQKKKLDLPLYYPGENLPELFNVQGIPATFIFNEKGELIRRIDGGEEYDTDKYRRLLK
jgi:thiol-disulfide isomerase/thioredoxin